MCLRSRWDIYVVFLEDKYELEGAAKLKGASLGASVAGANLRRDIISGAPGVVDGEDCSTNTGPSRCLGPAAVFICLFPCLFVYFIPLHSIDHRLDTFTCRP